MGPPSQQNAPFRGFQGPMSEAISRAIRFEHPPFPIQLNFYEDATGSSLRIVLEAEVCRGRGSRWSSQETTIMSHVLARHNAAELMVVIQSAIRTMLHVIVNELVTECLVVGITGTANL